MKVGYDQAMRNTSQHSYNSSKSSAGVVTVETIIVLLTILLLLIGLIHFAVFFLVKNNQMIAAREGARVASQLTGVIDQDDARIIQAVNARLEYLGFQNAVNVYNTANDAEVEIFNSGSEVCSREITVTVASEYTFGLANSLINLPTIPVVSHATFRFNQQELCY